MAVTVYYLIEPNYNRFVRSVYYLWLFYILFLTIDSSNCSYSVFSLSVFCFLCKLIHSGVFMFHVLTAVSYLLVITPYQSSTLQILSRCRNRQPHDRKTVSRAIRSSHVCLLKGHCILYIRSIYCESNLIPLGESKNQHKKCSWMLYCSTAVLYCPRGMLQHLYSYDAQYSIDVGDRWCRAGTGSGLK